jgi:zinc transporter 7
MVFYFIERLVRSNGGGGHSHGGHSHGHSHQHASEHAHDDKAASSHDHQHGAACGDDCEHSHGGDETASHGHSHDHHDHDHASAKASTGARKRRNASPARSTAGKAGKTAATKAAATKTATTKAATTKAAKAEEDHAEEAARGAAAGERRIAGYLNLAADAAHNFTDGLMIGAAYASPKSGFYGGLATTLACLMHEVPHEVGDVTILMQAGFSRAGAIKSQLLTAGGALLGTLLAVSTGRDESTAGLLLNFTAGGFIYVATVDVLPPLLTQPSTLWETTCQAFAMAAGVGMMVIVMYVEGEAEHWVQGAAGH